MKHRSAFTASPRLGAAISKHPRSQHTTRCYSLIAILLCLLIQTGRNSLILAQEHTNITVVLHNAKPGRQIPQSFLGFSMEYFNRGAEQILTPANRQQEHISSLFNNLGALNGPPMLRLGGNSADDSWWDPNGLQNPRGVSLRITPSLVQNVNGLIRSTGTKLLVGLNLGYSDPSLAVAWSRAALSHFPPNSIAAFEIGNESDLFPHHGLRPRTYSFQDYTYDFNTWLQALSPVFDGHRWAAGPAFTHGKWAADVPGFINKEHKSLALITQHQYALNACAAPNKAKYASIDNLLAGQEISDNYIKLISPIVSAASPYGIPVRLDETSYMLTAGCKGPTASGKSITDTFASALWTADVLFELARAGVSGVNFQTQPTHGAHVPAPFYTNTDGTLSVAPMYYGMMFFAKTVQHRAHFISTTYTNTANANVKVWATQDDAGNIRIAVLNKDLNISALVSVPLPDATSLQKRNPAHSSRIVPTGRLLRLSAPNIDATSGVTLAGQTFGGNGFAMGKETRTVIRPRNGIILFTVPQASAAILEIQKR